MANSEKHQWARWALGVGMIIFTWGMTYQQITAHGVAIIKLDSKDESQDSDIHALQLSQKDIEAMGQQTLGAITSIGIDTKSSASAIVQIQITLARMNNQLNNLEGVD